MSHEFSPFPYLCVEKLMWENFLMKLPLFHGYDRTLKILLTGDTQSQACCSLLQEARNSTYAQHVNLWFGKNYLIV